MFMNFAVKGASVFVLQCRSSLTYL